MLMHSGSLALAPPDGTAQLPCWPEQPGFLCVRLRQRFWLQSALLPHVHVGSGDGPGCFTHLKGVYINKGQLFWWEALMTFVLVRHRLHSTRAAICSSCELVVCSPAACSKTELPQGDPIRAVRTTANPLWIPRHGLLCS